MPGLFMHHIDIWTKSLCVPVGLPSKDYWLPDENDEAQYGRLKLAAAAPHWRDARATLKRILARYVQGEPQHIRFAYGAQGKPSLAPAHGTAGPHFNLSHTHHTMLLAVSHSFPIGVDIEYLRPLDDMVAIARRFFAPSEVVALLALPDDAQLPAFFRCWTRKEAVIKAIGMGLSLPLHAFAVSLENEAFSTVRWRDAWNGPRPPLAVVDLTFDRSHIAALALPAAEAYQLRWHDARDLTGSG